ncbi:MarR family transcriptional regulator [Streptomyces avidinii]|uniref:MarR family transcriptional regulator n=1 Tax=Streptomyces avidinii TaxID=1895 RepID=UPI0037A053CB
MHVDLLLSEDGRRTATELTRRLKVNPASVSVAVNFLVEHGYVRRERDPQRRRDIYVVDDDAWYHSIVISSRQTLEAAQASTAAAQTYGPESPVGQRPAKVGAFLEQVSLDNLVRPPPVGASIPPDPRGGEGPEGFLSASWR